MTHFSKEAKTFRVGYVSYPGSMHASVVLTGASGDASKGRIPSKRRPRSHVRRRGGSMIWKAAVVSVNDTMTDERVNFQEEISTIFYEINNQTKPSADYTGTSQ